MIVRGQIDRVDHFTIVPNEWARDESLSWKARGLMLWLMSHRAGWETSLERLASSGADGIDAVRSGLAELVKAGYLITLVERNAQGHVKGTLFTLVDPSKPDSDNPSQENPDQENPDQENPDQENPTPKKTNKTKNTNTKKNDPPLAALAGPPSARATRLPTGWTPSAVTIAQMGTERPGVALKDEHLKFVDYWVAQPGQRGTKLDWDATWRNWIRNAAAPRGGAVANGYRHATSDDAVAAVEALRLPPGERVNPLLPPTKEITR